MHTYTGFDADDLIDSGKVLATAVASHTVEFKSEDGHYKVEVTVREASEAQDKATTYRAQVLSVKCNDQGEWTGDDEIKLIPTMDGVPSKRQALKRDMHEGTVHLCPILRWSGSHVLRLQVRSGRYHQSKEFLSSRKPFSWRWLRWMLYRMTVMVATRWRGLSLRSEL